MLTKYALVAIVVLKLINSINYSFLNRNIRRIRCRQF